MGRAPVSQVQVGIVAAGDPAFRARAKHIREPAPGVAARLALHRNGVEAPDLFAGGRIVSADEAFLLAIRSATSQTLDQLAVHGKRSAGGGVRALGAVADGGIPDDLTVAGVEGHQVRFGGGYENLVAVNRDAAHRGRGRLAPVAVLPNEIAGSGIQGLQHHPVVVHIKHAVVDDRRGLVAEDGAVLHGPTPHQPQVVDVLSRDLIQRAEGIGLVIAADHQPIRRIRVMQSGIGYRSVVLHLARDGNAARRLCFLPGLILTGLARPRVRRPPAGTPPADRMRRSESLRSMPR